VGNRRVSRRMGARNRFIGGFVSPSISHTHRRLLESFYIPFIEQRKGIGVITVKNGLDNLLILFSVSWWT